MSGVCWLCGRHDVYVAELCRECCHFWRVSIARGGELYLSWCPLYPADRPCTDPPGSAGKIAELARRVANNMELWHPGDA